MDKLTQFFEDIKNISFWKRIFGWSQIRNLSYDAYEEFKTLLQKLETANSATTEVNNKLSLIEKENEHLRESKPEFAVLKEKVSGLEIENKRLDIENSNFKQTENAKKYAKEEGVKEGVFLVVPSNVVQAVKQFVYNLSDYKVYVITLGALEA